jgi:uncharacterized tellurite resistance protein B-like protein
LIAPLALKVASIDGDVDESEKDAITSYFVNQWGYEAHFVREGMAFIEKKLADFSVKGLARSLGEFKKQNRDCNFKAMSREIVAILREIIEADWCIDEREEMAVEKVQNIFEEVDRVNLKQFARSGFDTITGVARKIPFPKLPREKQQID